MPRNKYMAGRVIQLLPPPPPPPPPPFQFFFFFFFQWMHTHIMYCIPFGSGNTEEYSVLGLCIVPPCGWANPATLKLNIPRKEQKNWSHRGGTRTNALASRWQSNSSNHLALNSKAPNIARGRNTITLFFLGRKHYTLVLFLFKSHSFSRGMRAFY